MTASVPPSSVCAVVPTHNRPELLMQAVESIVQQDVADLQVVVVDDASTEPAAPAINDAFPQVTVLRNERSVGPAAARNQGAAAATADLVAFLDDDDRWLPGKLGRCLQCFGAHPDAGVVVHRMVPYGASASASGEVRVLTDPVGRMLTRQPPHVGAIVVRREVHERVRFDESFRAAEDLDYLLRLAMETHVVELDAVLSVHGRSDQRVTAIGLQTRIAARKQFRAKHEALFAAAPAEAFYQLRLGHLYRRGGERVQAAAAFTRSVRAKPSLAAIKGLGMVALPSQVVNRLAR